MWYQQGGGFVYAARTAQLVLHVTSLYCPLVTRNRVVTSLMHCPGADHTWCNSLGVLQPDVGGGGTWLPKFRWTRVCSWSRISP